MRGKACLKRPSGPGLRITPAYAGKSLCGLCLCRSRLGSPPRMRGKERLAKNQRSVHGITPAYAGKSTITEWQTNKQGDHPRVCGEKPFKVVWHIPPAGSPPRMRGKAKCKEPTQPDYRITPAYAGKSMYPSGFTLLYGDHPRVCGEKLARHHLRLLLPGSPPRMRGKVC